MLTNFFKRTILTGRIGSQQAFRFSTEGEKPSAVEITKENAQLIISK
jgi:hypothetical protein